MSIHLCELDIFTDLVRGLTFIRLPFSVNYLKAACGVMITGMLCVRCLLPL